MGWLTERLYSSQLTVSSIVHHIVHRHRVHCDVTTDPPCDVTTDQPRDVTTDPPAPEYINGMKVIRHIDRDKKLALVEKSDGSPVLVKYFKTLDNNDYIESNPNRTPGERSQKESRTIQDKKKWDNLLPIGGAVCGGAMIVMWVIRMRKLQGRDRIISTASTIAMVSVIASISIGHVLKSGPFSDEFRENPSLDNMKSMIKKEMEQAKEMLGLNGKE